MFAVYNQIRNNNIQALGVNDDLLITSKGTGKLYFGNESTAYQTILNNGNVGIGTTSPASLLHVNGGYGGNAAMTVNQTLGGDIFTASASGTTKVRISNAGILSVGGGAVISPSSGTVGLYIGTGGGTSTNMQEWGNTAYVNNFGQIYSLYGFRSSSYQGPNGSGAITVGPNTYMDTAGSSVTVGAGTRMTSASTFNSVIIAPNMGAATAGMNGTYNSLAITPTYNQSSGTGANNDLFINRTQTALSSGLQYLINAQADSVIKFGVSNTGNGYFAGNLGIGTTNPGYKLQVGAVGDGTEARANAWNSLSDLRFKDHIAPLSNSLEKIMQLQGVSFDWKSNGKSNLGLIAQNVQSVFPQLVSTDADGILSLNYDGLSAPIIAAIQEQQTQIDQLTTTNFASSSGVVTDAVFATWTSKLDEFIAYVTDTLDSLKVKFVTKESHQEKLCIGSSDNETCLTKEQLDTVLQNLSSPTLSQSATAGAQPAPSSSIVSAEASPSATPSIELSVSPIPSISETVTPTP